MELEKKEGHAVRMVMCEPTDMTHKPIALSRAGTLYGCGKPEKQPGKQSEQFDKRA